MGIEYQACNASYYSHTTTAIVFRDGGVNNASEITGFYWLAIAKQIFILQWGYLATATSTANVSAPFTISFTTACYICVKVGHSSSGNDWNLHHDSTWNYTTTTFTYRARTDTDQYWFALGKQQWGNITSAVNNGTVTLPISFTTTTYFATIDPTSDGSYFTNNVVITKRTVSNFSFKFYAGSLNRAWFCIGY